MDINELIYAIYFIAATFAIDALVKCIKSNPAGQAADHKNGG